MSGKIDETMEALDKNIKNLEEAEEINLKDCQNLLLDLFGTIRDLWESLKYIFEQAEKIKKIEQDTKDGVKYMEENGKSSIEVKGLYI